MLQHEFESRVGIEVSAKEYAAIEQVYMSSDVEKDEFCKLWAKMSRQRIARIKAERKAAAEFKALPIEEQVIVKMLVLAQQRANETGSTLPVSDTNIDANKVRARYDEADGFTVYLVLRDTGAAIEHTYTAAMQEAVDELENAASSVDEVIDYINNAKWCLMEIRGLKEGTEFEGKYNPVNNAFDFSWQGQDAMLWIGQNGELIKE